MRERISTELQYPNSIDNRGRLPAGRNGFEMTMSAILSEAKGSLRTPALDLAGFCLVRDMMRLSYLYNPRNQRSGTEEVYVVVRGNDK